MIHFWVTLVGADYHGRFKTQIETHALIIMPDSLVGFVPACYFGGNEFEKLVVAIERELWGRRPRLFLPTLSPYYFTSPSIFSAQPRAALYYTRRPVVPTDRLPLPPRLGMETSRRYPPTINHLKRLYSLL